PRRTLRLARPIHLQERLAHGVVGARRIAKERESSARAGRSFASWNRSRSQPLTMATEYESVIGLEVHAQLLTRTKIFCGCTTSFGDRANTNVCPVCLGLPGSLPVLNGEAVRMAVRIGLALGCSVQPRSIFARKNYFYPDLPKCYQISQFDQPLCTEGHLEIALEGQEPRKVGIVRVHME